MDPITGAALISGGSSLLGGLFGNKSAKRAAREQAAALREATAEQRRQFDLTREDFAPWRGAGVNALAQLADPNANFLASPDYQFVRNEGMRDVGNSFAARGGAFSGNALRALTERNANVASGEFGNWWNRRAGLAGVGQAATGSTAAAGANAAGNISQLLAAQGDARASGITSGANALLSGLGGLASAAGGYFGSRGGSNFSSMSNEDLMRFFIDGGP